MDELFREIDEELRQDRVRQFWQRQGTLILAAALVLIFAYGGFVYWQNWRQNQWVSAAQQYMVATNLVGQGDPASLNRAIAGYETLAQGGSGSGYALLGRIDAAVLKLQTGQIPQGLGSLQAIAADMSVPSSYRSAALVLWGYYAVDRTPPAEVETALAPLAVAGPWRYSATEITALARLRAGDKKTALLRFQSLSDDPAAPAPLRARAAEIISDLQN